ncbi:hypothetical protein KKC63_00395 [Patescibacteria group bacterium]|nr:hypothetical protein [Patescibacteria group bacterium]MBU4022958.1 hypothetical protein [Patescibacteria group bacterium]MBU4078085.1 hypothetical protein [Patescibacteria group bacterium]
MDDKIENLNEDNFNSAQEHNFHSTSPSAPYASASQTYPIKNVNKNPLIILGIALLLIIAYLIFSYFANFWPFGTSKESSIKLFEQVFEKIGEVKNASYEVVFGFEIIKKEEGMKALEVDYSNIQSPAIQRDYQRFSDLSQLRTGLETAFYDLGRYPNTFKQGNIQTKDPLGTDYSYEVIDNGDGYEITITFETQEAIDLITSWISPSYYDAVVINGKQVTFSNNSYYSYSFYYSFDPDKMKPAFVLLIENQGEYLSNIPGNLEASINTSGIFYREQDEMTDTSFSFGGEVEYEDMILRLSADFMRINDILYFRLNQIPGILLMFIGSEISSIKEEWIKITPQDMIDPYSIFEVFEYFRKMDEEPETRVTVMEELEVFFKVAIEQGLFLGQDNAKIEKLDGKNVFHYELGLNADTLPEFYTALTAELEQKFGDEAILKFSENTLRYLEAPQTITVVNYFNKNGKFDLFIETKTGYPLKISYRFALVPQSKVKSLENKQLVFSTEINLKDINKKVKINAPKDFISYDEAVMSMSGMSEDEYYFEKQKDNISTIRGALNAFYSLTDTYPDNLSELEISRYSLRDKDDSYIKTYQEEPLLKAIPTDVYTGIDYKYQKIQNQDYVLTYKMNLLKYDKGTRLNSNIYGRTYDTIGRLYNHHLIIVQGDNTTNKTVISKEAKQAQYIDSDNDGVSDSLEDYIGTNKNNKDTDGDGERDGFELSKYSDPLGSGQLEYDYPSYGY